MKISNEKLLFNFSESSEDIYNGAVEAAATLLGAVNVFIVGFLPINWVKWGDLAIIFVASVSALLLYLMSQTEQIWMAYIGIMILYLFS